MLNISTIRNADKIVQVVGYVPMEVVVAAVEIQRQRVVTLKH